jgi:hypothetical protein
MVYAASLHHLTTRLWGVRHVVESNASSVGFPLGPVRPAGDGEPAVVFVEDGDPGPFGGDGQPPGTRVVGEDVGVVCRRVPILRRRWV